MIKLGIDNNSEVREMSRSYRDVICDTINEIEDDAINIKTVAKEVLSDAESLQNLLNKEEYNTDEAQVLIDNIAYKMDEIVGKLDKLVDNLY